MRKAIESLATALREARPKRVLTISNYRAHISYNIRMPIMFREFEERLSQLSAHELFLRSAEYI